MIAGRERIIIDVENTKNLDATIHAREIKEYAKNNLQNKGKSDWIGKPLHGQHAREVQKEHINKQLANDWLTKGEIEPLVTVFKQLVLVITKPK